MEHRLQIEFINSKSRWRSLFFLGSDIIQTKPFYIGFRFKNIGDAPILGLTVSRVLWRSAAGQDLAWDTDKSFHLDTLNPQQVIEIWVARAGTYVHGLCNINLTVVPDTTGDTIKTFQVDRFTKEVSPCRNVNSWIEFFFIRSKSEYEQSSTNTLLIIMAIVTLYFAGYSIWMQINTASNIEKKNRADALEYCQSNPSSDWPKATGGKLTCGEILTMLGTSTSSE